MPPSTHAQIATPESSKMTRTSDLSDALPWATLVGWVYLLLVAVAAIGIGFKFAVGGQEGAAQLFAFATNPFAGLMVGILATALLQSSSTSTSIIVGLVAGGLPVSAAIPMVMGANIGTTVTNTIVSLGQAKAEDAFKRAFAAATVHDFFNFLGVAIFLPLEIYTKVLSRSADYLAGVFTGDIDSALSSFNILKAATQPPPIFLKDQLTSLGIADFWVGVALVTCGVLLIFLTIAAIGRLLRQVMIGRARALVHATIGRGSTVGILSGVVTTVAVQSSSTSTSLMVPLAGSGVFSIRDIYPFTLGANIGTTVTALLASTAIGGVAGMLALQIALVHFIYNLSAVVVIYGIPVLRNIPIKLADWLAGIAAERKTVALGYVLAMFFGLPALLIFLA